MDNNLENQFVNDLAAPPARPTFLKVLCILTITWASIMVLFSIIGGAACLSINEDNATEAGEKITEMYPNIQINVENWAEFFSSAGTALLITAVFNILSLVGAIMMWRLNKIGFFIYAAAELAAYFVSVDMSANASEGGKSYGGLIFKILLDVAFIAMYAIHLKYMNKNKANPQVQ